jgi:beta-glucosidase
LSYTSFDYEALSIDPSEMGPGGQATVRCRIRNSGSQKGTEVVQLYVTDDVASVSTPVRELRGVQRVELGPGESRMIEFRVGPNDLSLLDRHLDKVVEPGTFTLQVGHSSADIRLTGRLSVGGE